MKVTAVLLLACLLLSPAMSNASGLGIEISGGSYHGEHGSSHKGGKYKNPRTGDHYSKRKRK